MQIKFDEVKGYATYERALKRGEQFAEILTEGKWMAGSLPPRWLVVPIPQKGGGFRFVPAFYCGDVKGGPGPFIGQTNVCCFN